MPPPVRGRMRDPAALAVQQAADDVQPEADAAESALVTGLGLPEPAEDRVDVVGVDADAAVGDPEADGRRVGVRRDRHLAADRGVLVGVGEQFVDDHADRARVAGRPWQEVGQVEYRAAGCSPAAALPGPRRARAARRSNGPRSIVTSPESELSASSSRSTRTASWRVRSRIVRTAVSLASSSRFCPAVGEGLGVALDHGQRRAQFVAGGREEEVALLVLQPWAR